MTAQYHIDLEKYTLKKFKHNLETREMIPSRVSLKDNLDERFQVLENAGIINLQELLDVLKTRPKIEQFSEMTRLPIEYLTLLNREAKSYLPNPVRLDKLPGIQGSVVEKLEAIGIKNSRHLFNAAQDKTKREALALKLQVPISIVNELVGLSDLLRVYGVGPVFARMIYDVGIHSIQEFIRYSAEDFIEIYETKTQKKADFGVNEIEFSLVLAKELESSSEIKF
jgi:nucleotidyltransferase/DNA polymerase involved in DNA repair